MKNNDLDSIISDIKRLKAVFKNTKSLDAVNDFIENKKLVNIDLAFRSTTVTSEKIGKPDRCASVINAFENGMNEKSIIDEIRDHYTSIHPTQKPVRLLERLLMLCLPDKPKKEIVVADFFGGSMSTMEAVYNLGLNGISCELDKEYFELGEKRINNHISQTKLF